jgi:hypothetical protein
MEAIVDYYQFILNTCAQKIREMYLFLAKSCGLTVANLVFESETIHRSIIIQEIMKDNHFKVNLKNLSLLEYAS